MGTDTPSVPWIVARAKARAALSDQTKGNVMRITKGVAITSPAAARTAYALNIGTSWGQLSVTSPIPPTSSKLKTDPLTKREVIDGEIRVETFDLDANPLHVYTGGGLSYVIANGHYAESYVEIPGLLVIRETWNDNAPGQFATHKYEIVELDESAK